MENLHLTLGFHITGFGGERFEVHRTSRWRRAIWAIDGRVFTRSWSWDPTFGDRRLRQNLPASRKPTSAAYTQKTKKSRDLAIRCWDPNLSGWIPELRFGYPPLEKRRDKRATTNVQNGLAFFFLFSFKQALIWREVLGWKNPKGTLPKGTARKWKFKQVIKIPVKFQ